MLTAFFRYASELLFEMCRCVINVCFLTLIHTMFIGAIPNKKNELNIVGFKSNMLYAKMKNDSLLFLTSQRFSAIDTGKGARNRTATDLPSVRMGLTAVDNDNRYHFGQSAEWRLLATPFWTNSMRF